MDMNIIFTDGHHMTIGNWITFVGILMALFGPYLFKWNQNLNEKKVLIDVLKILLSKMEEETSRLKDGKNSEKDTDGQVVITLDRDPFPNFSNYFSYFEKFVLPNIGLLSNELQKRLLIFFDEYYKFFKGMKSDEAESVCFFEARSNEVINLIKGDKLTGAIGLKALLDEELIDKIEIIKAKIIKFFERLIVFSKKNN